jgi:hypothetical protein
MSYIILVLIYVNGGGPAMSTQRVNNIEACEILGKQWDNEHGTRVHQCLVVRQ